MLVHVCPCFSQISSFGKHLLDDVEELAKATAGAGVLMIFVDYWAKNGGRERERSSEGYSGHTPLLNFQL